MWQPPRKAVAAAKDRGDSVKRPRSVSERAIGAMLGDPRPGGGADMAQAKRQRDRPRNTAAISWICVFATGIADWKRGQASPHVAKAEGDIPPNAVWLG